MRKKLKWDLINYETCIFYFVLSNTVGIILGGLQNLRFVKSLVIQKFWYWKSFFVQHWAENFPQTIMRKHVLKAALLDLVFTILSSTSFIVVMNGLGWFGKLSNLSESRPENYFARTLLETGEYSVLGRGGGRMSGEHEPCGSVLSSAIRKSHFLLVCVLKIFITNVDNVRNRKKLSLWRYCYISVPNQPCSCSV